MPKDRKSTLYVIAGLLLLSLVLVACNTPTPVVTQPPAPTAAVATQSTAPTTAAPTAAPSEVAPQVAVPFEEAWAKSGHADAASEPFAHWNEANPAEVPTSCAKCHSSEGFVDFVKTGKVNAAVPAPPHVIGCDTCHNPAAAALTSVTFPSGKVVTTGEEGEALCMQCHQGRESKVSVDKQISDFKVTDVDAVVAPIKDANGKDVNFGFRNVHYFAAGATLYGSQAQMGYEYDGKVYDPKFRHVEGIDTCVACHDQHATTVRVEKCSECHTAVKTVDDLKNVREMGSLADYNGNGDTKEGISAELEGLQAILLSSIQSYAKEVAGTGIVYDPAAYPYWFADADGDGKADQKDNASVGYSTWTARLLKAAYNYQAAEKDPGAFAHNGKYIIELLHDSVEDLNAKLSTPVDLTKLAREDPGHFSGASMAFRDWDDTGEVPAGCAKCHSATGLPQFIHNNGTLAVTKSGLAITGVVGQPVANGFMCTTCHDGANWPNRYAVVNVPFPNGTTLTFSTEKDDKGNLKAVDSNLCIECHQGRESTVTVTNYIAGRPADTVDPKISFRNVHYFAAGATLFGNQAQGAFQYPDQKYVGFNAAHPINNCTDCHDVHALDVKMDVCTGCHPGVTDVRDIRYKTDTTDWNGNGDTKEGIDKEIETFRANLYAAIQKYAVDKSKTPIVYDTNAYPYWFVADASGAKALTADGKTTNYNAWTPRLLQAAYNLQYSIKDPGAFTHNPMYVMQFLYDSIKDLGGDVSKLTRPAVQ